MNGAVLQVGGLRATKNFVPLPYRRVSFQPYAGPMTEVAIQGHLLEREVYRRTDVVVLHDQGSRYAVAAIQRDGVEDLFNRVVAVEVLALPDSTVFVHAPQVDPANRSALARLARELGVGPDGTLIVQGAFDHINLIHHPDPLVVRVVEVTPPEPPKLLAMAEQVLGYADLPPICLEFERIDLPALCRVSAPEAFLVPCRSGGLDDLGAPVYFLDERPPERKAWTLIGCERSLQFHRHYYGDEPPRIEMCPRKLATFSTQPTLVKCCLLEFDLEQQGKTVIVPWGSDLPMIERALSLLAMESRDD